MPSRRSGRAIVALCGALIVATGVGIRSGAPGAAGTPLVTSIPTPLATSIGSSSGTWATLPMGRTNQPRNTFWQLFFQPAGATSWTDEVGATATATNGGLVLATAAGRPFIAGIRPANLLRFSPLISTTDGGVTWTNGVLPRGCPPTRIRCRRPPTAGRWHSSTAEPTPACWSARGASRSGGRW